MRRHGARLAIAVLAVVALCAGCGTWSGMRLYASGTRALDDGETAAAIAELEAAARLLPDSSEVQNHLGIAYEAAGRDGEARSAWQRSVDLDCSNEAAQRNLRAAEMRRTHTPAEVSPSP